MHVNRLETLVQVRKHDGVHDFDVGADDLIFAAVFLDVNQIFSCLVRHLFENVEKVNSLLYQDVDCEVRFALPH